jgi:CRISPR-associated endonuclease/helicase Cas3
MSSPAPLSPESFAEFFHALWGYDPFPWQEDFATRLCAGLPPDYVTVPTGSGKTACLDAAVFAIAVQASRPVAERTAGRRIFFIVNRRIIVDEAFERAKKLSEKLSDSFKTGADQNSPLAKVAAWLRHLAGGMSETPLTCAELRGGIYRDRAWAKSILQPMILCSTVDQAGSRLLFRGYGVSDEARPIHAALVAQDSLLLIDEAHISLPFLQTLDWVKRYRIHKPEGTKTVVLPFSIVRMTATPPKDNTATLLELTDKDRLHPILARRLSAPKPVRLVPAPKAKGKNAVPELVKKLEEVAAAIIVQQPPPKSIAIMVNRVKTARDLAKAFKSSDRQKVTLIIGRMRPLDRDQVTHDLQAVLKTGTKPGADTPLQIVISTQCLEVGADLDFDALVTECASLDALRQRFGRLNRDGRENITAQGVIVLPEAQNIEESKLSDDKLDDPIYGKAIPRTWRWLETLVKDGSVDFGLNAMTEAVKAARQGDEEAFNRLLMPRTNAPVLLPAYIDCWVQTNPTPAADPDVSLFLHGPQRDMAEVQVCWRKDLPENTENWAEAIALCPPTALECLPVPLHFMRQWLGNGGQLDDTSGDSPAATNDEPSKDSRKERPKIEVRVLCWLDEKSYLLESPSSIRPGQTLVLSAEDSAWETLGHVPEARPETIDLAEEGQARLRRRAVVRLHEKVWWPAGGEDSPAGQLTKWAKDPDFDLTKKAIQQALRALAESSDPSSFLISRLKHLASVDPKDLKYEPYPDGLGIVLSAQGYTPPNPDGEEGSTEDGPGDPLLETSKKQALGAHTAQVTELAKRYAAVLGLADYEPIISIAARLHDLGKADPRFQAMLIQSTVSAAYAQPALLAKSDSIPSSTAAREQVRQRAGLPKGFRHEMLSVQLATLPAAAARLPAGEAEKDLILHLIASHHGHARPFAPIVLDDEPPDIEFDEFKLSAKARNAAPAHTLDSGIAERFWLLTRLHGWWGLAMLEAVLRLADQTASANPES